MSHDSQNSIIDAVESWSGRLAWHRITSAEQLDPLKETLGSARSGNIESEPPLTLSILLLGATGAGKSELLNAMAGARIAKSHYLRPTTTAPTMYAHRELEEAQFLQYGTDFAELYRTEGTVVRHSRESLRRKIIVDAPDIDSFEIGHRETVMRLLHAVDLVLYVVTPLSYKDDMGWQTVLQERGKRAFAFVMNKWDPEGRPSTGNEPGADRDFIRLLERGGYPNPKVLRTSARFWVEKRVDSLETVQPDGDQFPELEAWIENGLATTEIAQIHMRRRRYLWGRLSSAISAATPPVVKSEEWTARLKEHTSVLRSSIDELLAAASSAAGGQIAGERNSTLRPFSPGPVGVTVRALSGLGSAAKRISSARADAEIKGPTAAGSVRSTSQVLAGETAERLELEFRRSGLSAEQLFETLREFAEQVPLQMGSGFERLVRQAAARPISNAKRVTGLILVGVLEAAATAVVLVAIYRLATGFVSAQYMTPAFAVNFLVLLLCLVVVGLMVNALFFGTSAAGVARQLYRPMRSDLNERIGQLDKETLGIIEELSELNRRGSELARHCEAQAAVAVEKMGETAESLFGVV